MRSHFYYTEPSKWQVIEERVDTSNNAEQQHVWGLRYIDDIVLRDRDTTSNGTLDERLYGMQDANWNVTALCNTGGVVQERFAYSAYGTPMFLNASFVVQTSSASYWQTLYAGYSFDVTVELFHVRNRVYHPMLGSWVQRDPLGLSAGINLYLYTEANPILRTDPSGLVVVVIIGGVAVTAGMILAAGGLALILNCIYVIPQCRDALGKLIDQLIDDIVELYKRIRELVRKCRRKKRMKICKPCPLPPPPQYHRVPNQHGCIFGHWHYFRYDQIPYPNCSCRLSRIDGGCLDIFGNPIKGS